MVSLFILIIFVQLLCMLVGEFGGYFVLSNLHCEILYGLLSYTPMF
jgi:hypothetical protein